MNCRDFESRWNELLDARSIPPAGLEPSMDDHAASCTHCRPLASGYHVLHLAVATLQTPAPSPASLARLRELRVPPPILPRIIGSGSRRRLAATFAAAAALLALAWLGPYRSWWRTANPAAGLTAGPPGAAPASLERALSEAREATIGLALEASAPASRIGRELLDFSRPETETAAVAGPVEEIDPEPNDALSSVGERVNAGIRPLPASARHAFGFLIGQPPESAPLPPEKHDGL